MITIVLQYSNINDIVINRAKKITVLCADTAAARDPLTALAFHKPQSHYHLYEHTSK